MTFQNIVKKGLKRIEQEEQEAEQRDAVRVNPDPEDLGVQCCPVHLSRAQMGFLVDILRGLPCDGLSRAEEQHLTQLLYAFAQPLSEWPDAECPHEGLMSTHFRAACGGDTYC
ncbi:MAG: hypothetical protein Q4C89_10210 [Deinococcus sp.]|uniref:hypothetical protein n=1 Tax=Deinococcus sp. TaxID=47478 RepID=UPI0026DAD479|nr:hypothetical protein [Deinococcus sp.]MDO4246385.1 hypothetical protein [Deinococcus sp.]